VQRPVQFNSISLDPLARNGAPATLPSVLAITSSTAAHLSSRLHAVG
jgi:hypothetical protein